MACAFWKSRMKMDPLGKIFHAKLSSRITRSANSDSLCKPVPGYPEVAANKLAQIWNILDLSSIKSLSGVRAAAREWCRKNSKLLL